MSPCGWSTVRTRMPPMFMLIGQYVGRARPPDSRSCRRRRRRSAARASPACPRARIAGDRAAAGMIELPQIVDAVAMIGMVVGPDHRVDVARRRRRAVARAGPGRCRPGSAALPCSTRIEARVRRLRGSVGIALAPVVADPRHAGRGAAAEDADLHRAAFANKAWKLALVALGQRLDAARREARRGSARYRRRRPARRSCRGAAPARGTGASVSISSRSAAARAASPADPWRS